MKEGTDHAMGAGELTTIDAGVPRAVENSVDVELTEHTVCTSSVPTPTPAIAMDALPDVGTVTTEVKLRISFEDVHRTVTKSFPRVGGLRSDTTIVSANPTATDGGNEIISTNFCGSTGRVNVVWSGR